MTVVYILLGIVAGMLVYSITNWLKMRKIVNTLSEEEFRAGYRKAQIIDVREANEFDAGHILGARNIPLSQMKMRMKELRKDQPVYLYCQNGMRSGQSAKTLHKNGYQQLYQLDGGFKKWTGKVKSK